MKLHFKYIVFLALAALFSTGSIHAQKTDSREGEIVMSQAQLDTFLTKLTERRKAFLANRKKDQKEVEDLKTDRLKERQEYMSSYRSERRADDRYSQSERRSSSYDEDRLYREFARINDRIDNLFVIMSNRGAANTASYDSDASRQPQVIYEQQQPTYAPPEPQSERSSTPERSSRSSDNQQIPQSSIAPKTSPDTTGTGDIRSLQLRINEMDEKMRILDKLGETTGSDEYDKESADLQKRIDELNEELEAKQKTLDEQNEATKAMAKFKDFSKTIYFANNSSSIKDADVKDLEEVVQMVKDNKPNLTVALHGFSSKSGSAEYNEKLSFRRAESVKKALLDAGLSSKDLLIMNHGVDAEGSADKARRVEVNLIVN